MYKYIKIILKMQAFSKPGHLNFVFINKFKISLLIVFTVFIALVILSLNAYGKNLNHEDKGVNNLTNGFDLQLENYPVLMQKDQDPSIKLNELNQKALTAYKEKKYDEGLVWAHKAYEHAVKNFGIYHSHTLAALNNLAGMYYFHGHYERAEIIFKEAFKVSKETMGLKHVNTLDMLNNLANLYRVWGHYENAEFFIKKTLKFRKEVLGEKHPDTLTSISSLATLYYSQARYEEAEAFFQTVLELREEVLGTKHPDTLISLNNLAFLYQLVGSDEVAEPLFMQTFKLTKENFGPEHVDTLTCLNNLAFFYKNVGRYSEAESLFKQVLETRKKTLGEHHPDALMSLNNLALLYQIQARFEEAEAFFHKAIDVDKEIFEKKRSVKLKILSGLAFLYHNLARFEEAAQLFNKSIELMEDIAPEHPDMLVLKLNYSVCLISLKNEKQAVELLKNVESKLINSTGLRLASLMNYINHEQALFSISDFKNIVFTLAWLYKSIDTAHFAADVMLRWKQVQEEYKTYLIEISQDVKLKKISEKIIEMNSRLAEIIYSPRANMQSEQILYINNQIKNKEKMLARKSRDYKKLMKVCKADTDDLRSCLQPESAFIEFEIYNPIDFTTGKTEDQHLAAYLLLSSGQNQHVFFEDMGEVKKLEKAVTNSQEKETYESLSMNLFKKFDKIWEIKKLYITADNLLNLAFFESFILPDGIPWKKEHTYQIVKTGRELLHLSLSENRLPDSFFDNLSPAVIDGQAPSYTSSTNENPL
ncbi:hypothetical protein GMMP15_1170011 [Candidatus Magnetomoraceae bacterium gMMP-15]